MSKRIKTSHDPETHSRHLKRQLESLEKDNHTSLNNVEGLINVALQQDDDSEFIISFKQYIYMFVC